VDWDSGLRSCPRIPVNSGLVLTEKEEGVSSNVRLTNGRQ
jgi:hypothetical protein